MLPTWTPKHYGLNGSDPEKILDSLVSAAAALARAENSLLESRPHPRDYPELGAIPSEVALPYLEIKAAIGEAFEIVQREIRSIEAATGLTE